MTVRAFAVCFLVDIAVNINALLAAYGAYGSACNTSFAKFQSGVERNSAIRVQVHLAELLLARGVAAVVPDVRVALMVRSLIADAPICRVDVSGIAFIALITELHSIHVDIVLVDAGHSHVRSNACGRVDNGEHTPSSNQGRRFGGL